MGLKAELSFFDLTNIIVGSIVGADIYVASALTAGMIGPFSIIVWLVAGIIATLIAIVFAYCSYYVPKVGGPFAYVSQAFDEFYGFLTGWSMWIAELIALPVFAIAFTNYLQFFIVLDFLQQIVVKALFIFGLTYVNLMGVKIAGRVNDILTIVKLFPLVLLILVGISFLVLNPQELTGNYLPLVPLGLGNFGTALVLIFWAYVGFELGTLPASEVKDPKRAIPKAIVTGMAIVMLFYLLTNFVIYGTTNWRDLAKTQIPLVLVGSALLGNLGAVIMSAGALVSVSGSDESAVLGTARLSYAMAINGLFPKIFSKIHPDHRTPYAALVIQGLIGFVLSIFSGISGLISFSVFNLAFAFLLVCMSLIVLKRPREKKLRGQRVLPWIGIIICVYLIYSTSIFDKAVGSAVILLGIPLYVFFSPKADIHHLKELFLTEEAVLARALEGREKFLANFVRLVYRALRKIRAWLR